MLGNRLKEIRKEKGLSQKAFAEPLSTSSGYISEVEQGKKSPGSDFLSSLSRVYGLSIDWLLTGNGNAYLRGQNIVSNNKSGGIEVSAAIEMAKEVLISNSNFSSTLNTIIFSFHEAMISEEKYKAIAKQLENVGCNQLICINEARIRHDDPQQQKKEILKRRAI